MSVVAGLLHVKCSIAEHNGQCDGIYRPRATGSCSEGTDESITFTFNVPVEIDREKQCECEHHWGQASLIDSLIPGVQE